MDIGYCPQTLAKVISLYLIMLLVFITQNIQKKILYVILDRRLVPLCLINQYYNFLTNEIQ